MDRESLETQSSGQGNSLEAGLVSPSGRGRINRGTISSDQVAWLLDMAKRYVPKDRHPSVSRQEEMKHYGLLYEVMEIMGVGFADENAAHNGSPPDCRYIEPKTNS